ncbi:polymer-forming cytoskeletal protein [Aestuariibius sp. 2305UL40-4]|uniref:polymer-forming cytoskeletal protein n=1 Tax=Aestuariibius violaceus TaxID=3234132 RepID=UPI00345E202B
MLFSDSVAKAISAAGYRSRLLSTSALTGVAVALVLMPYEAISQQTLFFDGSPDPGIQLENDPWNTVDERWQDDAAGAGPRILYSDDDNVVFGPPTSGSGTAVVNIDDGAVAPSSISFTADGYRIVGDAIRSAQGDYNLADPTTPGTNTGVLEIFVAADVEAEIAAPLEGDGAAVDGSFVLTGDGELTITADSPSLGAFLVTSEATLVNTGTMGDDAPADTTVTVEGTFNNSGTVNGDVINDGGTVTSSGTIAGDYDGTNDAVGTTLTGTVGGNVSTDGGSILVDDTLDVATGTVTVRGTVDDNAASLTADAALNTTGLVVSGANGTDTGTVVIDADGADGTENNLSSIDEISIGDNGSLTIGTNVTTDPSAAGMDAGVVTANGVGVEVAEAGALTVRESATLTGVVQNSGDVTVMGPDAEIAGNVTNTDTGTVTNAGTITGIVTNTGGVVDSSGTITGDYVGTNDDGSSLAGTVTGSVSTTGGALTVDDDLDVTGTVTVTGNDTDEAASLTADATLDTAGLIMAGTAGNVATVTIDADGDDGSENNESMIDVISVGNNSLLTIRTDVRADDSGSGVTVAAAGTLAVEDNATLTSDVDSSGDVNVAENAEITGNVVNNSGGEVTSAGAIGGTVTNTGGTVVSSGTITGDYAGTDDVDGTRLSGTIGGSLSTSGGDVDIDDALEVGGTVTVSSTAASNATLDVTGALTAEALVLSGESGNTGTATIDTASEIDTIDVQDGGVLNLNADVTLLDGEPPVGADPGTDLDAELTVAEGGVLVVGDNVSTTGGEVSVSGVVQANGTDSTLNIGDNLFIITGTDGGAVGGRVSGAEGGLTIIANQFLLQDGSTVDMTNVLLDGGIFNQTDLVFDDDETLRGDLTNENTVTINAEVNATEAGEDPYDVINRQGDPISDLPGEFTISAGGALIGVGTFTNETDATLTLEEASGSDPAAVLEAEDLVNNGIINGDIVIGGAGANAQTIDQGATGDILGDLTINSPGSTLGGDILVATSGGGGNLIINESTSIDEAMNVENATSVNNDGTVLTVTADGALTTDTFDNNADAATTVEAGGSVAATTTATNAGGATLTLEGDGSSAQLTAATLDNDGEVVGGENLDVGSLLNDGIIRGDVVVGGPGANADTIDQGADGEIFGTLTINSAGSTLAGSIRETAPDVDGNLNINVSSTIDGPLNVDNRTTVGGGGTVLTVNGTGALTTGEFTNNASTTIESGGQILGVNEFANSVGATLTLEAGGTLQATTLDNDGEVFGGSNLNVTNIENDGVINGDIVIGGTGANAQTIDQGAGGDIVGNLTINTTGNTLGGDILESAPDVGGNLIINESTTIDEAMNVANNTSVNNSGTVLTVDGPDGALTTETFTNQGGTTTTIENGGVITVTDANPTTNNGVINVENGTFNGSITNQDELTVGEMGQVTGNVVSNDDLDMDGTVTGDVTINNGGNTLGSDDASDPASIGGDLEMTSGTNAVDGALVVTGATTVTGGSSTLDVISGGDLTTTTLNNGGTVNVEDGGEVTVTGGPTTNTASLNVDGTFNGDVNNTTGTLDIGGTGTVNGDVDNDSQMDFAGTVDGTVINDGTINVTGDASVTGDLTNNSTITSSTDGSRIDVTGTFFNDGTIAADATVSTTADAALTIEAGVLEFGANSVISGDVILLGAMNNDGEVTFEEDQALTGNILNNGHIFVGGPGNPSDTAQIDGAGNDINNAAAASSLTVREGSSLTGLGRVDNAGTVTVAGVMSAGETENDNILTVTGTIGGLVDNNATFTLDGTMNGNLENSGDADLEGSIDGNITTSAGSDIDLTGDLDVSGNVDIAGGTTLDVVAGSLTGVDTLDNAGTTTVGGSVGITADAINNTGTLTSTGTLTADVTSDGTLNIENSVDGNLNLTGGTADLTGALDVTGALNNDITIVVDAGDLTVGGLISNDGDITVNGGQLMSSDVAIENNATALLTNAGTIEAPEVRNADGGTLNSTGTIRGDLDNSGDATIRTSVTGDVTTEGTGLTTINGDLVIGGAVLGTGDVVVTAGTTNVDLVDLQGGGSSLTMNVGTSLVTEPGGTVINGGGTFDISGRINTSRLENDGLMTLTSTGTVQGLMDNDADMILNGRVEGDLDNSGIATVEGGESATVTGEFTNEDADSELIVDGALTVAGGVDNAGEVDVNGTLDADVDNSGEVSVDGTLMGDVDNLLDGDVTVAASGTLDGSLDNEAGATATLLNVVTGDVTSDGTVDAEGTIGGSVSNGGTFVATETLGITGSVDTSGDFTVAAGTTSAASVTNDGDLLVTGGSGLTATSIQNDGTMTNDGSVTGSIDTSDTLTQSATGSTDGDITNSGTATMAGSQTGTFENTSGGTLMTGADPFNITGMLDNDGLAEIDGDLTATTIDNSGRIELSGTLNGDVTNTGVIFVDSVQTINGSLTNSGRLGMANGSPGDEVTINGDVSGGGEYVLDVNLTDAGSGESGALADTVVVNGDVTGDITLVFNDLTTDYGQQEDDVIVFDANNDDFSFGSTLPINAGLLVYEPIRVGDGSQIALRDTLNPAIDGIASNITLTQSLIGSIVNRPSSPFVSGLAYEDEDNCGPGGWARALGGTADVEGETEIDGISRPTELTADYYGVQFGGDYACFNGFYRGWDLAFGGIGGINIGETEQPVFLSSVDGSSRARISTNFTEFEQTYLGVYMTASRGPFSADLQYRIENTDFDIRNEARSGSADLGLDSTFSSNAQTLSGSASYFFPVGDTGFGIIPTAGFAITQTETDEIEFDNGERLKIEDSTATVSFAGATLSKSQFAENGLSALNYFGTFTYYDDFGAQFDSVFTRIDTDGSEVETDSSTEKLGGYSELSAGLSYVRILDPGDLANARQFNASVRADARFSENIESYGLTAQVRLQF